MGVDGGMAGMMGMNAMAAATGMLSTNSLGAISSAQALTANVFNGAIHNASSFIPAVSLSGLPKASDVVPAMWRAVSRIQEAGTLQVSARADLDGYTPPDYVSKGDATTSALVAASMFATAFLFMGVVTGASLWDRIKSIFAPNTNDAAKLAEGSTATPRAAKVPTFGDGRHMVRGADRTGTTIPPPAEEKPRPGAKF